MYYPPQLPANYRKDKNYAPPGCVDTEDEFGTVASGNWRCDWMLMFVIKGSILVPGLQQHKLEKCKMILKITFFEE